MKSPKTCKSGFYFEHIIFIYYYYCLFICLFIWRRNAVFLSVTLEVRFSVSALVLLSNAVWCIREQCLCTDVSRCLDVTEMTETSRSLSPVDECVYE